MNIAIVTSTFPPYRGGMGNVAEEEARLLAARGHVVTVFIPEQSENISGSKDGYQIQEIKPLFRYGNAAFIPGLYFKLKGFEAVHLHYPFFGGAETVAFARAWGRIQRLTVRYHMDTLGRGWLKPIFWLYGKMILPLVMREADRIIVSTESYAATSPQIGKYWPEWSGVREVIPFPIPERPTPVPGKLQEKYFLFVGGMDRAHYFKGVENLLRAFALASEQAHGFKLHLVGEGDLRQAFQKLSQKLGLADRVVFHSSLPNSPELSALYRDAHAVIFPSIDRSEAFGLVALEALSHGTPLIASKLPGVSEVASKKAALQVAPGDVTALAVALGLLARDHELHARLRAGALEEAKRYNQVAYLDRLEQVLKV